MELLFEYAWPFRLEGSANVRPSRSVRRPSGSPHVLKPIVIALAVALAFGGEGALAATSDGTMVGAPVPQDATPAGGAAPGSADELPDPGYVPGYRAYQGLSLGPTGPRVGALPGGVTAGYSAPMPLTQWTFRLGGSLNDSFQSSLGHRMVTGPGQTSTVFHIPPQVIDEYASFLGTSTMPGQWVAINMAYGTPVVSANLSL